MRLKPLYIILLLLLFLTLDEARAQQDAQYSQYTFNTTTINPAYTGGRGRTTVLALYRQQWAGMEGAPQTMGLSVDTPIDQSGVVGLGLEFTNDKIGPSEKNLLAANFAYIIPVTEKIDFSFGLKGGIHTLDIDMTKLNIYDPNNIDLNLTNKVMPVAGLGFYLYTSKWFVGLSTPNLLQTKHYNDVQLSTATEKMHLYMVGGYAIELSDEIDLKPSAMIKGVKGAPLSVTTGVRATFYDRFFVGTAYNFDASIAFMAGFEINEYVMFGYIYDYSTTPISRYNNGSHEFLLRFQLEPGDYPNRVLQEF